MVKIDIITIIERAQLILNPTNMKKILILFVWNVLGAESLSAQPVSVYRVFEFVKVEKWSKQ